MNQIQFRSIDLNLFRVLLTLLEHRSVTRAAEDLALTPSAVSHALARLRASLDDPLFERKGGQLVPTTYALELGRQVRPALSQLRRAVDRSEFDPATAERDFTIAGGTYVSSVLLPQLIQTLGETAPGIRINLERIEGSYLDDVEHGRLDLAIGVPQAATGRLAWAPLAEEDMVWAARTGHPFIKAPLTLDMLAKAQHVVIERLSTLIEPDYTEARRFFDETPDLQNTARNIPATSKVRSTVRVRDPSHALAIVSRSDLVTLTLRGLAETWQARTLQILEPPHPCPTMRIGAIYRPSQTQDPALAWLLEMMGRIKDAQPSESNSASDQRAPD
ncbi:LysR family transcriptional regulator [Henriciella aquimarina]|uniref:LysR family transcriptional regulator n=1 Tax=Henriciella aquimarina TaxID=545261 RepID=UPI000A033D2D|nr:LysR family transcriptional regulator [Henriciella aquimarina]